jgi:hypothetical protein
MGPPRKSVSLIHTHTDIYTVRCCIYLYCISISNRDTSPPLFCHPQVCWPWPVLSISSSHSSNLKKNSFLPSSHYFFFYSSSQEKNDKRVYNMLLDLHYTSQNNIHGGLFIFFFKLFSKFLLWRASCWVKPRNWFKQDNLSFETTKTNWVHFFRFKNCPITCFFQEKLSHWIMTS